MDHHTLAAVSIVGTSLDVLGGLYLAYDVLGGQHRPLRLLTRAVTYSIVFGINYGIAIGTMVNPYTEYFADNLPACRLGAFGIGLILCGFALQSVQYWLELFDVRLT